MKCFLKFFSLGLLFSLILFQSVFSREEEYDHDFRYLFEEAKIHSFLEFGMDSATAYFLERCERVTSIEFLVEDQISNIAPLYYKNQEALKQYLNWSPVLHPFSSKVNEANKRAIQNINSSLRDHSYVTEINKFIKSLFSEREFDLVFVHPKIFLHADFVNALFGFVDIIVAREGGFDEGDNDIDKVQTPMSYEKIKCPHDSRIIFWIVKEKGELISSIKARLGKSCEEAFTEIYKKGVWGGKWFSGGGAWIEYAQPYVDFLQNFLREKNIQSVVDVGCGDWLFSQYIDWSGVHYVGCDAVEFIVERNRECFGQPSIDFLHLDALDSELPDADLLICKDVLQHLSNEDVIRFLARLGKYKYCLITNDVKGNTFTSANRDISRGEHRPIDLIAPPFNLEAKIAFRYYSQFVWKQVYLLENGASQTK